MNINKLDIFKKEDQHKKSEKIDGIFVKEAKTFYMFSLRTEYSNVIEINHPVLMKVKFLTLLSVLLLSL